MLELTDRQWELLKEGSEIDKQLARFQADIGNPELSDEQVAHYMTESVRKVLRLRVIMGILNGEIEDDGIDTDG